MDFDDMAFQDKFGVSHQRDSADESATSSFGSPSGGLHLLWSAVQEVTSSSESDDASYELSDQTALSTTSLSTSDQSGPNNITFEREGTASSRRGSKATTTAAAVSRSKRAATRSQKQALMPELEDSPFVDLDTVAPLGKRQQTALSCMRCRTTHKKCDESRPCQRCVKLGCDNDCHDALPRGQSKSKWKALPVEQKQKRKQQSWLVNHKPSPAHPSPSSSDVGQLEDTMPFMAEHHMLPPPNGLPALSQWPRQLHYHPYPFYSPPSYLAPLPPSSMSSSSGSSSAASSMSPPRLPLSTFSEDNNRANDGYGLPYLPPPAQSYYTMNLFNHCPPLFR